METTSGSSPTTQIAVADTGKTALRQRGPRVSKATKPNVIRQSKRQRESKSKQTVKLSADTKPFILTPAKLELIIETVAREYVELKGLDPAETSRIVDVCTDIANTQFEEALTDANEAVRSEVIVKTEDDLGEQEKSAENVRARTELARYH